MKNQIALLAVSLLSSVTFAQKMQEKEVPTVVKMSFQKQFSNAKETKWEKEETNYEAEFKLDNTEQSALLDAHGKLIETEVEIAVNELPQNIRKYVNVMHQGQKIIEAAKITDAKNVVTYETEIKGKDLIFDANGKFLKAIQK